MFHPSPRSHELLDAGYDDRQSLDHRRDAHQVVLLCVCRTCSCCGLRLVYSAPFFGRSFGSRVLGVIDCREWACTEAVLGPGRVGGLTVGRSESLAVGRYSSPVVVSTRVSKPSQPHGCAQPLIGKGPYRACPKIAAKASAPRDESMNYCAISAVWSASGKQGVKE